MAEANELYKIRNSISSLSTELTEFWLFLFTKLYSEDFEKFPYKESLEKVTTHLGKYFNKLTKVVPATKDAKDLLSGIYHFMKTDVRPLLQDLKTYGNWRDYHWKDGFKELDKEIKDLDELEPVLNKTEDMVVHNYNMLNTMDAEGRLPDIKPEKKPKRRKVEAKVLAVIILLSLGFMALSMTSGTQNVPAGLLSLPTAEAVGINFELMYVLSSSMVLSVYAIGKVFGSW